MSTDLIKFSRGIFTEALTKYRAEIFLFVLPSVTAGTKFPYSLCEIIYGYLAPSMAQFAALVLAPPTTHDFAGWDIIQFGTSPAVAVPNSHRRPTFIGIGLKDLDNLDLLAIRICQKLNMFVSIHSMVTMLVRILQHRISAYTSSFESVHKSYF